MPLNKYVAGKVAGREGAMLVLRRIIDAHPDTAL
jgi:hypothetical protein